MNDTAKLIMHRLIARAIARDPSLIERAKAVLAQARNDYSYVRDWDDILSRPTAEVRQLLTKRGEKMTRLRLSSPFAFVGIDFTEPRLRHRIFQDARQRFKHSLSFKGKKE